MKNAVSINKTQTWISCSGRDKTLISTYFWFKGRYVPGIFSITFGIALFFLLIYIFYIWSSRIALQWIIRVAFRTGQYDFLYLHPAKKSHVTNIFWVTLETTIPLCGYMFLHLISQNTSVIAHQKMVFRTGHFYFSEEKMGKWLSKSLIFPI